MNELINDELMRKAAKKTAEGYRKYPIGSAVSGPKQAPGTVETYSRFLRGACTLTDITAATSIASFFLIEAIRVRRKGFSLPMAENIQASTLVPDAKNKPIERVLLDAGDAIEIVARNQDGEPHWFFASFETHATGEELAKADAAWVAEVEARAR